MERAQRHEAGVYEALASSDHTPDWVAGISIGAINAAIVAGSAPKDRVYRLRRFWHEITAPIMPWPHATGTLAKCGNGSRIRPTRLLQSSDLVFIRQVRQLLLDIGAQSDVGATGRLRSHQHWKGDAAVSAPSTSRPVTSFISTVGK